MKKLYILLLLIGCAVFNNSQAQYVTIPDTAFVSWLNNNGFAGCMNGNQMDTSCSAILNADTLNCYAVPIHDLTGVQYFKNIASLDCSNDSLYFIPAFPGSLNTINCEFNNLDSLPALPSGLQLLTCNNNQFGTLPALPEGLTSLICGSNQIDSLPALSLTLHTLDCSSNHLSNLPALPAGLWSLTCSTNPLDTLPPLPAGLTSLGCKLCQLISLPDLPAGLTMLLCDNNSLTTLPPLPAALINLLCYTNQLTSLPDLPPGLVIINCEGNQLDSLPALPVTLQTLFCDNNNLNSLPTLPNSINWINCSENNLTSLPELPDSLFQFYCSVNPNLSCLPQIKRIVNLNFSNTAITCLPDYGSVTNSTPALSSLPLCGIFNPYGCQPFWNISGQCYYDQNNDCSFDSIDVGTYSVKTQLYSGGVLQQQVYTGGEGFYSFDSVNYGNYTMQVDTSNLPFVVSCPDTGNYSVSLSAADSLSYDNNFAFTCRTEGFDVGVKCILNNWIIPRPSDTIALCTLAGDMSELYGAHCASGISGQVQLTYNGQITYVSPAAGALTPTSINGNTISWNIADFGTVSDFTAFNLIFQINSNATPGTQACFTVNVTPTAGDYNPSNNTGNYCFTIVNALDPNEKEVYPAANVDTSSWLTYTIRFQNTGTAPAVNIRITDTLDSHLDPSTFQLLAYSAKNLTQIFGNNVVFNFPNINLPDSATSDSASRGYVQYKIKMLDNLPIGTQIQNTANIYFDLNPAVVTNTTVNTISNRTGIAPVSDELSMQLYPNPAKNYVIVETGAYAIGGSLQITDVTGRTVGKFQVSSSKFQIPTSAFSGGVYFVKLSDNVGRNASRKLVVE